MAAYGSELRKAIMLFPAWCVLMCRGGGSCAPASSNAGGGGSTTKCQCDLFVASVTPCTLKIAPSLSLSPSADTSMAVDTSSSAMVSSGGEYLARATC
jgi:hypothetical protein